MDFKTNVLQDLFLLFTNDGREEKVVLGVSDSPYKKRYSTFGAVQTITMDGWRSFCRAMPGLLESTIINIDQIFLQFIGISAGTKPKFELNFAQFLEAVDFLASSKYPLMDADKAESVFFDRHVIPLYKAKFNTVPVELTTSPQVADDVGSVRSSARRRASRVVLTTSGPAAVTGTSPVSRAAVSLNVGSAIPPAPELPTIPPPPVRPSIRFSPTPPARPPPRSPPRPVSEDDHEMDQVERQFNSNLSAYSELQRSISPARTTEHVHSPAAQTGTSDYTVDDMKKIIKQLIASVEALTAANRALKVENTALRRQLGGSL